MRNEHTQNITATQAHQLSRFVSVKSVIRKFVVVIAALSFSSSSFSQIDTSIWLISKVDFQPQYELHDGTQIGLMGYTKTLGAPINIPAPTLNLEEGDSVSLNLWNFSQGAPHSIHLHGLDVDQANDGVPSLSFDVEHEDTGSYYFEVPHPGTYLYHCHVTSVLHVQGGMYGLVVVRPKSDPNLTWENGFAFDSENSWLMSEVDTTWHHDSIINHPHDTTAMTHVILPYGPQHFVVNGLSESQLSTMPLVASVGERVYMRLANIGYFSNRVIFPAGMNASIIASDGRPLPNTFDSDTVDIFPGERFGVMLEADTEFNGVVQIQYVDLNTQNITNTQEIDLTVSGFVGLEDEEAVAQLVFPNPASTEVQLPVSGTWNIVDLTGRSTGVIVSENTIFNVSSLSPGTYVLTNTEVPGLTVKLMIAR